MAISDVKLKLTFGTNDEQTHFYFDTPSNPSLSDKGVLITWSDSGSNDPYTIEYSADGGGNWGVVDTGVTDLYYEWHLDDTEFNAIFNGVDANPSIVIRVTDDLNNDDTSATHTFAKQTMSAIFPNSTITDKDSDTTHESPISYYDVFNIVWDQLYSTPMQTVDVILTYGGSDYTIYEAIPYITFNATWCLAIYNLPSLVNTQIQMAGTSPNYNAFCSVTVKGAKGTNHESNSITSTQFMITGGDKKNSDNATLRAHQPAERLDTFKRVSLEKGVLLDEALAISQIEAGRGVKVTQRDTLGRRVGADGKYDTFEGDPSTGTPDPDSTDLKKANNLVISIDESQLSIREARSKQGTFCPTTLVSSWQAGADKYGTMYSYDIVHNWSLGDVSDPYYVAGQNMSSYTLQIRNIEDDNAYDASLPLNATMVQYETIDKDTIRCYAVKKGGAIQPTLPKDKVDDNALSDYIFEYVLVEKI